MIALAYLVCALVWGTTFFAIRQCIGPEGYPTILAAALRFVIAAAILWAIVGVGLARPVPRGRKVWAWLGVAGLLNVIGYTCTYTAEERITGGLACVLFGTMPLVTGLLSWATRTERVSRAAIVGCVVSLGGIVIISWRELVESPQQFIGVTLMMVAVVASSLYNMVFKHHVQGQHPLVTTAAFLGVTAIGMSVLALGVEQKPLPSPLPVGPSIALVYLAIFGSVIAFACLFYLIKRVSLMAVSTLTLVEPVVALVVDAFYEHKALSPITYLGAAITMGGVAASIVYDARQARRAAAAAAEAPAAA